MSTQNTSSQERIHPTHLLQPTQRAIKPRRWSSLSAALNSRPEKDGVVHHQQTDDGAKLAVTPPSTLLKLPAVQLITSMSRSKIYALIQQDAFPAPLKAGKTSLWRLVEVEGWIAGLIQERDLGRREGH